jgi:hypothetical protein
MSEFWRDCFAAVFPLIVHIRSKAEIWFVVVTGAGRESQNEAIANHPFARSLPRFAPAGRSRLTILADRARTPFDLNDKMKFEKKGATKIPATKFKR